MNIIVKNALIIDGTNAPGYIGDIFIKEDRIDKILTDPILSGELEKEANHVIDAKGLVCAPGFIDTHSHSDLKVLSDPMLLPKLKQGITTEVLGQDGIAMAPLPLAYIEPWRKNLAGLDGENNAIDWTFQDTKHYLQMIEAAKPALNESYLLPHGNVRMEAMGLSDKAPTKEDIQKMCDITRREMEAGCIGFSSGLIYMPCAFSQTEEIIEICKVVKEFNGLFVVHQRSEADTILSSMDEILRIGRESGVQIHFSHFKVCGKQNWDKLPAMLHKLDQAKAEGIEVSLDQYPYIAGSTMLGVILPPWVHDGGTDQLVLRLQSKELREKMKQDIQNGISGWDNFVQFAGTEGIFVTSVLSDKNQNIVGLSLDEIGKKWGVEPLDAAFDLLLEEKNAVGMVDFYGTEDHVISILKRPETNVCTDGLLSGKPHPRVYGSFPRVLGKYARENALFTMEEAVYKMTGKAAKAFHIKERGIIKEGYFADITIFNPSTVIDKGTFSNPEQYPEGIAYVIVNGQIEIALGEFTGDRAGRVIRR